MLHWTTWLQLPYIMDGTAKYCFHHSTLIHSFPLISMPSLCPVWFWSFSYPTVSAADGFLFSGWLGVITILISHHYMKIIPHALTLCAIIGGSSCELVSGGNVNCRRSQWSRRCWRCRRFHICHILYGRQNIIGEKVLMTLHLIAIVKCWVFALDSNRICVENSSNFFIE